MTLSAGTWMSLYRSLLRIRRVEEEIARVYADQEMRCPTHLCIGQEAIAAGVCGALAPGDAVFSNHRAHAHYLAKGGDMKKLVAELYGRSGGCSGGFGGSMHLVDAKAGFLGSTPIVGGTVPLAVGAAWAFRHRREGKIAVAFFGDGCVEEGVLHEALNFASLKRLGVLFVCENNGYSVFTNLRARQPERPITQIASAHGCGVFSGDGNDVAAVFDAAERAVAAVRAGAGPQFLEFFTHRWLEHCGPNTDDHIAYREKNELERWKERCPLELARRFLEKEKMLDPRHIAELEAEVRSEIEAAFAFAQKSPPPSPRGLAGKVYAR